jgi:hypothetical protein
MCVLYQTTLIKITSKSCGYRIVSYNHVMVLNLNIFKIVLSFAPPPSTILVKLHLNHAWTEYFGSDLT